MLMQIGPNVSLQVGLLHLFLVYFGESIVYWKSKKQDIVSRSSTESDSKELASVTCEITWILKLYFDLGVKNLFLVKVFCDNDSAIKLALTHVFHEKTKHFEVVVHFVRDRV